MFLLLKRKFTLVYSDKWHLTHLNRHKLKKLISYYYYLINKKNTHYVT
ncbi:hypothetical protein P20480_0692 [Pseudoalteromonas sp. BSi20480]|nr:hypothetical protein P20480_0692 [Pseudoalteromonas sp. BSi20480]